MSETVSGTTGAAETAPPYCGCVGSSTSLSALKEICESSISSLTCDAGCGSVSGNREVGLTTSGSLGCSTGSAASTAR